MPSSKDRFRAAAEAQVEQAAREVPVEHRDELVGAGGHGRDERLVIRLSSDELRRLSRYAADRNLPFSTWARATLLDAARRGA